MPRARPSPAAAQFDTPGGGGGGGGVLAEAAEGKGKSIEIHSLSALKTLFTLSRNLSPDTLRYSTTRHYASPHMTSKH